MPAARDTPSISCPANTASSTKCHFLEDAFTLVKRADVSIIAMREHANNSGSNMTLHSATCGCSLCPDQAALLFDFRGRKLAVPAYYCTFDFAAMESEVSRVCPSHLRGEDIAQSCMLMEDQYLTELVHSQCMQQPQRTT